MKRNHRETTESGGGESNSRPELGTLGLYH